MQPCPGPHALRVRLHVHLSLRCICPCVAVPSPAAAVSEHTGQNPCTDIPYVKLTTVYTAWFASLCPSRAKRRLYDIAQSALWVCRFFTFADMVHAQSLAAVQLLQTGQWRSRPRQRDRLNVIMLTGAQLGGRCFALRTASVMPAHLSALRCGGGLACWLQQHACRVLADRGLTAAAGDTGTSARRIAEATGIQHFSAGLSPEAKLQAVGKARSAQRSRRGSGVIMVSSMLSLCRLRVTLRGACIAHACSSTQS